MTRAALRTLLAATSLLGVLTAFDQSAADVRLRKDATVPDSPMGEGVIKPADGVRISVSGDGGLNFLNVGVGLFSLESAPLPTGSPFTPLMTFCLEINEALVWSAATIDYDVVALNSPASGLDIFQKQRIERMWQNHFATAVADATADRGERLAAFQAAIWEIVEDGAGNAAPTYSLTGGDFQIDCANAGDVCTFATAYLTSPSLEGGPGAGNLVRLEHPEQQDLIAFTSGPGGLGDPVPVPATALLFGAGLLGLGVMRRRR